MNLHLFGNAPTTLSQHRPTVYDQQREPQRTVHLSLTQLEWALLVAVLRTPNFTDPAQTRPINDLADIICAQLEAQ